MYEILSQPISHAQWKLYIFAGSTVYVYAHHVYMYVIPNKILDSKATIVLGTKMVLLWHSQHVKIYIYLINKHFKHKPVWIFPYPSVLTFVLGA